MSRLRTSFVLGYHGCEQEVGEKILNGEEFKPSDEDLDWLGPGAYFWESDPDRADEWARARKGARALRNPFVVGAVIDLRNCLDLTTQSGVSALQASFESLRIGQTKAGLPLPVNEDLKYDPHKDKLMRRLDNAVVRHLHQNIKEEYEKWRKEGHTDRLHLNPLTQSVDYFRKVEKLSKAREFWRGPIPR